MRLAARARGGSGNPADPARLRTHIVGKGWFINSQTRPLHASEEYETRHQSFTSPQPPRIVVLRGPHLSFIIIQGLGFGVQGLGFREFGFGREGVRGVRADPARLRVEIAFRG